MILSIPMKGLLLYTVSGRFLTFLWSGKKYSSTIAIRVSNSASGIASHSPASPISRGRRINPGIMNMTPLISI